MSEIDELRNIVRESAEFHASELAKLQKRVETLEIVIKKVLEKKGF